MSLTVVFSPEAEAQLLDLYNYIAAESSSEIAVRYTDGIVSYCESLCVFPHRGVLREDLRPGLRVTGYRKRVAIAFVVASDRLNILGIFYGGKNYDASFLSEDID
jgi:toxin ParE1/3/4